VNRLQTLVPKKASARSFRNSSIDIGRQSKKRGNDEKIEKSQLVHFFRGDRVRVSYN